MLRRCGVSCCVRARGTSHGPGVWARGTCPAWPRAVGPRAGAPPRGMATLWDHDTVSGYRFAAPGYPGRAAAGPRRKTSVFNCKPEGHVHCRCGPRFSEPEGSASAGTEREGASMEQSRTNAVNLKVQRRCSGIESNHRLITSQRLCELKFLCDEVSSNSEDCSL